MDSFEHKLSPLRISHNSKNVHIHTISPKSSPESVQSPSSGNLHINVDDSHSLGDEIQSIRDDTHSLGDEINYLRDRKQSLRDELQSVKEDCENENKYEQIELLVGTPTTKTNQIKQNVLSKNYRSNSVETNDNKKKNEIKSRPIFLLEKIGTKSMGYRWMHDQEYAYYIKVDNNLKIISLILAGILTTLSSSTLTDTVAQNNSIVNAINILQLIFSLLVIIFLGIKDNGDYKMRAVEHKSTSTEFATIYHSIQKEFAIDKNKLVDEIFINDIVKDYDKLSSDAPIIRRSTMDKYSDILKSGHSIITDELDNLDIGSVNTNNISPDIDNNEGIDPKHKYEFDRWLKHF
jgi:hypothetical protein